MHQPGRSRAAVDRALTFALEGGQVLTETSARLNGRGAAYGPGRRGLHAAIAHDMYEQARPGRRLHVPDALLPSKWASFH